eukprot:ANDGO_07111.mRNA.1 ARF guanine-nucleotide exchange factor GNOM
MLDESRRVLILAELDTLLFSVRSSPKYNISRIRRSFVSGPSSDEHEPSMRTLLAIESSVRVVQNLCSVSPYLSSESDLSCQQVLHPFLETILSEDTSAFLTSVAMSCLYKLICNNIITTADPQNVYADVITALDRCKFESSDSTLDEIVFMKALQVLSALARSDAFCIMSAKAIHNIVHISYRICRHQKCTDLLRRMAEHTLADVLIVLFSKLRKPESFSEDLLSGLEMIFEYLLELSDSVLGLSFLVTALEACGRSLVSAPRLMAFVQDKVCAALLRNLFATSSSLISHTFRCLHILIVLFFKELKGQVECLLVDGPLRIFSQSDSLVKDMILDIFQHICLNEDFLEYVFCTYDCSLCHTNLFDEICRFLSKHCFPSNDLLPHQNITCFECLASILRNIQRTLESVEHSPSETVNLSVVKKQKHKLLSLIDAFNRSSKKGLLALKEAEVIPSQEDDQQAVETALFIRAFSALGLDPAVVGDFLGDPDLQSLNTLKAYTRLFDFTSMRIEEALRWFLTFFRLPGEAQKIDRIMSEFSQHYFEQNKDQPFLVVSPSSSKEASFSFLSSDCAYVLSFSIIMLNTDLHNPQVKNKMSLEGFVKNNRGINESQDLPFEFLESIYVNIRDNEIQLSQALHMVFSSPFRWKEIISDERQVFLSRMGFMRGLGQLSSFDGVLSLPKAVIAKEMYLSLWGPSMAAYSVLFDNTSTPALLQKVSMAFVSSAQVASMCGLTEIVDKYVAGLSKFTSILSPINVSQSVSLYGQSERSLCATSTVFAVAKRCGDSMREGWKNVVDLIIRMCSCGVLAGDSLLGDEVSAEDWERIYKYSADFHRRQTKSSNFNFLSSIFSSAEDEYRMQADFETRAKNIINDCGIGDLLFSESRIFGSESLLYLLRAVILSSTSGDTYGRNSDVSGEPATGFTGPSGEILAEISSTHGSFSRLLCLEVLLKLSLVNRDRISVTWSYVSEFLSVILKNAGRLAASGSSLLLERGALGLIRASTRLMHRENMRSFLSQSLTELLNLPEAGLPFSVYLSLAKSSSAFVLEAGKYVVDAGTWRCLLSFFVKLIDALKSFDSRKRNLEEVTNLISGAIGTVIREHYWVFPHNVVDLCGVLEHLAESDTVEESLRIPAAESCLGLYIILVNSHVDVDPSVLVLPLETLFKFAVMDTAKDAIQHSGLVFLQRALLAPEAAVLSPNTWFCLFDRLVFPLLEKYRSDVDDHQLRAFSISAKCVLHSLSKLSSSTEWEQFWHRFLSVFATRADSVAKRCDLLVDALPELMKNLVLVLRSSGVLEGNLSKYTRKVLESSVYLKILLPELFPESVSVVPETEVEKSSSSSPEDSAAAAMDVIESVSG